MLRFIIGLVTGVAIGAAAATATQGQSGQDLRAEFERIRADIEKRDFEALGNHLEERFKELQASIEEKINEASAEAEAAEDAAEEAADEVEAGVEEEAASDDAAEDDGTA